MFTQLSVLGRWDITEDEKELILDWLTDTAVHWGIDGQQREQVCGIFYEESSWKEAEERLLLGYAQGADDNLSFRLYPDREIVGVDVSADIPLLNIWLSFIADLFAFYKQSLQIKTAEEWFALVNKILENYFPESDKDLEQVLENTGEFY